MLRGRLGGVKEEPEVRGRLGIMKQEPEELRGRLGGMKQEPEELRGRLGGMKQESEELRGRLGGLRQEPEDEISSGLSIRSAAKQIMENFERQSEGVSSSRLENRIGQSQPRDLRDQLSQDKRATNGSYSNDRKRKTGDTRDELDDDMKIVIHQDVRPAKMLYDRSDRDVSREELILMRMEEGLNRRSLRPSDLQRGFDGLPERDELRERSRASLGIQDLMSIGMSRDSVRELELARLREEILTEQGMRDFDLLDARGRGPTTSLGRRGYSSRDALIEDDLMIARREQDRLIERSLAQRQALALQEEEERQFELEQQIKKRQLLEEQLRVQERQLKLQEQRLKMQEQQQKEEMQQSRLDVGRKPTKFGSILESKRQSAVAGGLKPINTVTKQPATTGKTSNIAGRLGNLNKTENVSDMNEKKKMTRKSSVPEFRQAIDQELMKHVKQLTPKNHADYKIRLLQFAPTGTAQSMNERFSSIISVS